MQKLTAYVDSLGDRAYRDADVLETIYWKWSRTMAETADLLDCTRTTVRKWMNEHGIPTRTRAEANRLRASREPAALTIDAAGYMAWRTRCSEETDDDGRRKKWVSVHRLTAVAEYGFEAVIDNHVHHALFIPWLNFGHSEQLGFAGLTVHDEAEHQEIHQEAEIPLDDFEHHTADAASA